ncbi:hypothetical protein SLS62_005905 [Diatrype stigma]|uniref:UBC core domain-containing protein n=1 Tax=Diatrype stigma TaxID=117547 RepID=A0AAN9URY4_9PEZI
MATTQKFNSRSPTIRRILKEAAEISNAPSPDYTATPLESDLFEWHFTLTGPPNSSYAGGIYHGRIVLPPTYPLRPPSFRFTTPSGRFEANREICLSISGHHEETWQPAWGVRTALVALRSFMETDARGQLGGLDTSDAVRRRLAAESRAWRCAVCARTNEEIVRECEDRCKELEASSSGSGSGANGAVEVPTELKMGFRDEMEKKEKEKTAAAATGAGAEAGDSRDGDDARDDDSESAQLAEGFVQTGPVRQEPPPAAPPSALPARPAQGVPAPTGALAPRMDPAGQVDTAGVRRVDPNAGVPPWLDYVIMSLAVLLIAMLLKVLGGF